MKKLLFILLLFVSISELESRIVWYSPLGCGLRDPDYMPLKSPMYYLYPQIGINSFSTNKGNSDLITSRLGFSYGINFDYILYYLPRSTHLFSFNINYNKKNMIYNYNSDKINEELKSILLSPNYLFLYKNYKYYIDFFIKTGLYYEVNTEESLSNSFKINEDIININNFNNYDFGLNIEFGLEYVISFYATTLVISYNYQKGFKDKFTNVPNFKNETHLINLKILLFFEDKFTYDDDKDTEPFRKFNP